LKFTHAEFTHAHTSRTHYAAQQTNQQEQHPPQQQALVLVFRLPVWALRLPASAPLVPEPQLALLWRLERQQHREHQQRQAQVWPSIRAGSVSLSEKSCARARVWVALLSTMRGAGLAQVSVFLCLLSVYLG